MRYIYKLLISGLALLVPLAGCDTEKLHNLNINPQALNEVNMNFLFSAAQLGAASGGSEGDNRYIDWRTNIGYCSYWVQHLANSGGGGLSSGDKYFENVESDNAPWEFIYGGQLKNLNEVLKQTGEGGFEEGRRKNTREAARILRAFLFQRLTDYYGNIPYSSALQGIEGEFFPEYDNQQAIYTAVLSELEQAGAAISASNPDDGFAAADMIFQGDVDKWKRWANSIMLRMAMRMSNVDAATAGTMVTKALSGAGVFNSNDDIPWVPMSETPSQWTNQNGISRAFIPGDGGQSRIMSKTLIDVLKGDDPNSVADDDPRLMIFSDGVNGDTDPLAQEGMPNGLDAGTLDEYTGITGTNPNELFSRLNVAFIDVDDPYMLMSYAEVEFLQAEAIERGIGTVSGSAKEHYDAGVRAAMQMYEPFDASFAVSDAAVDAYLAAYPYTNGGANALEMIGTQMWLSKFLNWWEAWSDYRRTGYPNLTPIDYPGNITNGQIPRRLRYPSHEIATNSDNIASGGTSPDTHLGKVWWDVN
ncbi:SusD/RagB family nutrient-binding outer membrane lipoprotein [Flexithrix dorotheae]|uniref:SusD/RagB family nutrient-binding outer membrane lipoprotein n=1 Tax=Flexithrix dorotheae TaxID=70993 RepID=UPI000476C54B|nr:SusD/RagB family nutrient-binding outer membrane lipoprotein [Flexithrix dorotheae]